MDIVLKTLVTLLVVPPTLCFFIRWITFLHNVEKQQAADKLLSSIRIISVILLLAVIVFYKNIMLMHILFATIIGMAFVLLYAMLKRW